MCINYNPFYWLERELDLQYEAEQHGFENYEDYYNSLKDDLENEAYDKWKEERIYKQ